MMETMIPPQVGMRLRMKNKKIKRKKKREKGKKGEKEKNERKERRDGATTSYSTLVPQSGTLFFI